MDHEEHGQDRGDHRQKDEQHPDVGRFSQMFADDRNVGPGRGQHQGRGGEPQHTADRGRRHAVRAFEGGADHDCLLHP
jgi:hypothetical protein